MAGLVPFNRRGLPTRFDDDFVEMIDDFFSDRKWPSRNLLSDTFKIDVAEDDEAYYLDVELPGTKKEEIDINFDNERLTISVTRDEDIKKDDEKKNVIHRERRFSSMSRSVFLRGASEDGVSAKMDNGVLSITVPKAKPKEEATKKIEIE